MTSRENTPSQGPRDDWTGPPWVPMTSTDLVVKVFLERTLVRVDLSYRSRICSNLDDFLDGRKKFFPKSKSTAPPKIFLTAYWDNAPSCVLVRGARDAKRCHECWNFQVFSQSLAACHRDRAFLQKIGQLLVRGRDRWWHYGDPWVDRYAAVFQNDSFTPPARWTHAAWNSGTCYFLQVFLIDDGRNFCGV